MKKTMLFVFTVLFSITLSAQREILIKHNLFVPQNNIGAVKMLIFDYFGDNFQFQGKRKVWRKKEESYMYMVSTRNQKLKIYYKGFHDEMGEKIDAFYKDVLKLSDY